MDLQQLLELNKSYNDVHNKVQDLLLDILNRGEITPDDNTELDNLLEQDQSNYNEITNIQDTTKEDDILHKIDELKATKVGCTIDDILNILTENGKKTIFYKDEKGNVLIDGSSIPELTIVSRTLNFIATEDEDTSEISINPNFIKLISKDIELTADNIKLEGLVTANKNFKILSDGSIEAVNAKFSGDITGSTFSSNNSIFKVLEDGSVEVNNLSINGELSCDKLTVNDITNANYPAILDDDIIVNINPNEESATALENNSTFATIGDLENILPRNLNGYTLTINLLADYPGNIILDFMNSGNIILNLNTHTVKGYIKCTNPSNYFEIYGNNQDNTGGETNYGKVMPNKGIYRNSYRFTILADCTRVSIYDIDVYKGLATDYPNSGILGDNMSIIEIINVRFINEPRHGIRTNNISRAYVRSSSGLTEGNTFSAIGGSIQHLAATTQAGRTSGTSITYTLNNSQIFSEGVTFSTTAISGDNTNTEDTATTKTVTIVPNYGDTYRKTVYYNWKQDGTVRQGDYGYGDCQGLWFFGSKLSSYANKNITKISITIKRNSGGISAAVTHTLKLHNHSVRPSGAPTFLDTYTKQFSIAVGDSITIDITNTDDIAKFKAAKGFGLNPSSFTSSNYSVCSGNCEVKITYTE